MLICFSTSRTRGSRVLVQNTVGGEAFPGGPLFLVDPVIVAQLIGPFARPQIEPEDLDIDWYSFSPARIRLWLRSHILADERG
jgi:hypothetical protein